MIRAKVELLRARDSARRRAAALARDVARPISIWRAGVSRAVRGRSSSPSAGCRAAASRRWRAPSPLRSGRFRARCMCGATWSGSACSACAPEARLPEGAYEASVSPQVYAMCRKRAAWALSAGRSVIVDAVHAKPEERDAVAALARVHGAGFTGLWLEAPVEVMQARVGRAAAMCPMRPRRVVGEQAPTISARSALTASMRALPSRRSPRSAWRASLPAISQRALIHPLLTRCGRQCALRLRRGPLGFAFEVPPAHPLSSPSGGRERCVGVGQLTPAHRAGGT